MFIHHMFGIYNQVSMAGLPNFIGARVPVPSNLNLAVLRDIATTPEHYRFVDFLIYGFPADFEGVDRPKKNSSNRRVILDLSCPLLQAPSINRGMARDAYLGVPKRMSRKGSLDV